MVKPTPGACQQKKNRKNQLAPGRFDQFVTTVGDSAFAFGAPLPSGAVSSSMARGLYERSVDLVLHLVVRGRHPEFRV